MWEKEENQSLQRGTIQAEGWWRVHIRIPCSLRSPRAAGPAPPGRLSWKVSQHLPWLPTHTAPELRWCLLESLMLKAPPGLRNHALRGESWAPNVFRRNRMRLGWEWGWPWDGRNPQQLSLLEKASVFWNQNSAPGWPWATLASISASLKWAHYFLLGGCYAQQGV